MPPKKTALKHKPSFMNYKVGFGFDVHQLREGEPFVLGGITIPHEKGSFGHSDGDALIHAICDALLGAANLGDIGQHFPDTSQEFKDIDSKILLKKVAALLEEKDYKIGNIDVTIGLEKPKVNPFIPKMKSALCRVLNMGTDNLSIKATTNEKMGFVGRQEGIGVHAVTLIYS